MSDPLGNDTPGDSRANPIGAFRKNDRVEDKGRAARESQRVNRYVEQNPITSLVITVVCGFGVMFVKDQVRPQVIAAPVAVAQTPQGEEILKKIEELHKAVDGITGDIRALKDADLGNRLRVVEDKTIKKEASDDAKEKAADVRRISWEAWREKIDKELQELRKK